MQRLIYFLAIFLIGGALLIFCQTALAASVHYNLDQLGTEIIYQAFIGDFQITIPQGQYSYVDIYVFQKSAENIFQDTELISQVYDYYILSPEVNDEAIFTISLGYQTNSLQAKHLYLWNYRGKRWQFQPSQNDLKSKTVSAKIKGKKGIVAVFEMKSQITREHQVNYNNQFYLELPSTVIDKQVTTTVESFATFNYPEEKNRVSDIYQFAIKTKEKLDLSEPIELTIRYQLENNLRKAVYYWDNNQNSWVNIPSWTNYYDKTVSAYIHLPFARVALFEEPNQWVGEASWYRWKNGHYAASRNFPKGTKLKVTNTTKASKNFGKSVIVSVNDYGPEEWTGRLIDLDKAAFGQIGYLRSGVIPVIIEVVANAK